MASPKPISHRKAASSFINDNNDVNLIQLSPHRDTFNLEQRSPYTMTSNQESLTNFIGDTILAPERSRAFVVTKTGEKHLLDVDAAALTKSSSNPFTLHSPRFSAPTMERISEKSNSQLSLTETMNKSKSKLNKKPKHPKHNISHKQRLVFTPRNMETTSSTQLLATARQTDLSTPMKNIRKSQNTSTETQTEYFPSLSCSSFKPSQFKSTNVTGCLNHMPMEGPRKYFNETRINSQSLYEMTSSPPSLKPLKIYTTYNPTLRKYTELRSIASALTLITVISWLFSSFFDIKCLWDYLDGWWQYFQNWFLTKEKPKTKVEILVSFLQDLWS
ncbi:uncharacterized protein LOC135956213 [Calliphora vicina]|uniref:uncharacterized protein LOC135956213 n=1 Tax=Calliphora vicina TaxID=7373 RepID=UPI00325A4573